MPAKILDGKATALTLQNKLQSIITTKNLTNKITLAVILVGENPASQVYVKNKLLACNQVGIKVLSYNLPTNTSFDDLLNLIQSLNNNTEVHGILLQLPLPENITNNNDRIINKILDTISPNKDVDGFNPYNIGRLAQRLPHIRPCTPKGVMHLLEQYHISVKSKNVTIVGSSNIVGKPLALEMLMAGATVTVCHKLTKDLIAHCNNADILCSAVGHPNLINKSHIKKNAVIVDVGITRLSNGVIVGDVNYGEAYEVADYITPVPGGVGPMTVAMLLENTIECYQLLTGNQIIN